MSVYIQGMEMPKDGVKHLCVYSDGTVFDTMEFQGPLAKAIELPPHGRLIDADAYLKSERPNGISDEVWKESHIYKSVTAQPTIIEAEGGDAK